MRHKRRSCCEWIFYSSTVDWIQWFTMTNERNCFHEMITICFSLVFVKFHRCSRSDISSIIFSVVRLAAALFEVNRRCSSRDRRLIFLQLSVVVLQLDFVQFLFVELRVHELFSRPKERVLCPIWDKRRENFLRWINFNFTRDCPLKSLDQAILCRNHLYPITNRFYNFHDPNKENLFKMLIESLRDKKIHCWINMKKNFQILWFGSFIVFRQGLIDFIKRIVFIDADKLSKRHRQTVRCLDTTQGNDQSQLVMNFDLFYWFNLLLFSYQRKQIVSFVKFE